MLFKFKDFSLSEENQFQVSSVVDLHLSEIRDFFDDIDQLGVSHLGLREKGVKAYQARLAGLKKNPWTSTASYRLFVRDMVHDFQVAKQFELRKSTLQKLQDNSPGGFWKKIELLMESNPMVAAFKVIKRRLMDQGDFVLYPVKALIELGEDYLPEVGRLKVVLNGVQENLNQLKHHEKISEEVYLLSQSYMQRIAKRLDNFSSSLVSSLWARLETANKHIDISDADNLVGDVKEIKYLIARNRLIDPLLVNLRVPGRLGQGLTLTDFNSLHKLLESYKAPLIKERLDLLNWRSSNQGFNLLSDLDSSIHIIPSGLYEFVFPRPNWFERLFFYNRYCYDFPVRYGIIFAKIKQLSKYKRVIPFDKYDLAKDGNLSELRLVQNDLENVYAQVDLEKSSGIFSYLFGGKKKSLISEFQKILRGQLKIVIKRKLEILKEHRDSIRSCRDFSARLATSVSNTQSIANLYLSEPLEGQVMGLCAEISKDLADVYLGENNSLWNELRETQSYMAQFYLTREKLPVSDSSTFFIEEFSRKDFLSILTLEGDLLKRQFELFVGRVNHLIFQGDATEQATAMKSLCQFTRKYMAYYKSHLLTDLDGNRQFAINLQQIEQLSSKFSPDLWYVTNIFRSLSLLRAEPCTSVTKLRIECVIQESDSVVASVLDDSDRQLSPRSSSSTTRTHSSFFHERRSSGESRGVYVSHLSENRPVLA